MTKNPALSLPFWLEAIPLPYLSTVADENNVPADVYGKNIDNPLGNVRLEIRARFTTRNIIPPPTHAEVMLVMSLGFVRPLSIVGKTLIRIGSEEVSVISPLHVYNGRLNLVAASIMHEICIQYLEKDLPAFTLENLAQMMLQPIESQRIL